MKTVPGHNIIMLLLLLVVYCKYCVAVYSHTVITAVVFACYDIWIWYKRLSYRRRMARCALLVDNLSTAAQLYKRLHLRRLAIGE